MVKKFLAKDGFTLVEVLVATGVVVLVLVGLASGTSFAVRNTRFSKEKTLSVRHAQEAMEWLRGRRDIMGWPAFYEAINQDGNSITYCLDQLPTDQSGFVSLSNVDDPLDGDCDPIGSTSYIRTIDVTVDSSSQLTVVVEVNWTEGQGFETTRLESSLREWR